jgi:hypothetical protein
MKNQEILRRSTSSTLNEIVDGERKFKEENEIDIRDEDEWQQLKDIVARIESKLIVKDVAE